MTQHLKQQKQQKEENLPSKTQEKEPVPEAPKAKITENAPPENCIIPMYPEESNSSYYNEIMAMKNQQNVLNQLWNASHLFQNVSSNCNFTFQMQNRNFLLLKVTPKTVIVKQFYIYYKDINLIKNYLLLLKAEKLW